MTAPQWWSQGEAHLPTGLDWLGPLERERAEGMRYTKRRDEFLVSRWTAKNAVVLAAGGDLRPADVQVLPAHDGAPVPYLRGQAWDRRLSMTDRAGWAVTMLSPDATEVGCDLELVEPRSDGFITDWLTAAEQRRVGAARDAEQRYLLANLVWSAKESALKVLRTGLRRSTHSVEVSLGDDLDPDGWAPLTVTAAEGDTFPGWWCRYGEFVLTMCAQRDLPAPVSLTEPAPLATAEPAHTWLHRPTR